MMLLLIITGINLMVSVALNDYRHSIFLRQLNRPTFEISGLKNVCNFLEYRDVFLWHNRFESGG